MDCSEVFDCYQLDEDKLLEYGFYLDNDCYIFQEFIDESLCVKFFIRSNFFCVRVFEVETDMEFLPFLVSSNKGKYLSFVREKVEYLKQDILRHCFVPFSIRENIFQYIFDKYHTTPQNPWKDTPLHCTFKTDKGKWYGILMNVPYRSLGIEKSGCIDVLNLKNTPEKIQSLVDFHIYFPAYHMNKKHWISILLTREVDLEAVFTLIDESYLLVDAK